MWFIPCQYPKWWGTGVLSPHSQDHRNISLAFLEIKALETNLKVVNIYPFITTLVIVKAIPITRD